MKEGTEEKAGDYQKALKYYMSLRGSNKFLRRKLLMAMNALKEHEHVPKVAPFPIQKRKETSHDLVSLCRVYFYCQEGTLGIIMLMHRERSVE